MREIVGPLRRLFALLPVEYVLDEEGGAVLRQARVVREALGLQIAHRSRRDRGSGGLVSDLSCSIVTKQSASGAEARRLDLRTSSSAYYAISTLNGAKQVLMSSGGGGRELIRRR